METLRFDGIFFSEYLENKFLEVFFTLNLS